MFCITIALDHNPTVWALLFKDENAAALAFANLSNSITNNIVDDFGQSVFIPSGKIAGMMIEDLDKSALAHTERQMHIWRLQARTQAAGRNDPVLKTAALTSGPAMFDPVGNGRMHG